MTADTGASIAANRTEAVIESLIRDRVTVRFTPLGAGSVESTELLVESMNHTVRNGRWETVFGFSPAEIYDDLGASNWIVLGNGTTGVSDGTRTLAP